LDDRGSIPGSGKEIFLFSVGPRPAMVPTQPPTKWVPGVCYLGAKLPGREADNSLPSSVEAKNTWSYTPLSIRLHCVVLN
jgi:hypothetical protein